MMINILYQFNEKYVPYTGTSIASLMENNRHIDEITIFLMGENISERNKRQLIRQIELYGRKASFIDSKPIISKIRELGINNYRGSYATNIKMMVSEFIPCTVKRLLYIDSDTVVVGDLKDLESFDMSDNPIAMVLDSMCATHKRMLGFAKESPYFNGGVILFDMDCWRRKQCTERICNHLTTVRNHYMAPDQDVINIVLKGEISRLDIRYNIQPLHIDYQFNTYCRFFLQPAYYTKAEVHSALENPVIIHFFRYLGEFPWHKNCLHPDKELFDSYLAKSLWSDYVKAPTSKNDIVFRMERWLYRVLPKGVFLAVFKVSYELFLWKSNRDSIKGINNARM